MTLLYQSYNAPLECPVTRTQQRGTEPARSDSFSYNGRNELTAATLGAAPYGYSYDNIGNRKTAQELAQELAYAANGLNQYTGIEESGEAPFVPTYDASGNQTLIKTSTGVWTVVYNAANRAVSFTSRNGNTIIECGYDYQGRRYMKKVTENGTVASHERYLYRGYLQIAALDMLDNRDVLRTLLWDSLEPVATRPLALVQDASLYCYGEDFNKNVTGVFDAQGTITAAYDYSPLWTGGFHGQPRTTRPPVGYQKQQCRRTHAHNGWNPHYHIFTVNQFPIVAGCRCFDKRTTISNNPYYPEYTGDLPRRN